MQSGLLAPTGREGQGGSRLPYIAGLDGLRALAVIAVLLYHADVGVRGGFLGVEAFFVLSGYLITGLLLAEWHQTERINLRAFWLRRARRLLPALLLVLVGTLAFAALALPDELPGLANDTLAALGYVMNWKLVLSQQSYFDPLVRPSLLQHLWSLAIEEQFYLCWPLLFSAGMRYLRHVGLLITILIAACTSALLTAWLFQPDADPSRVYYGTDTRASGLLIGSALAMIWTPGRIPAANSRSTGLALDLFGLAGLSALCAGFLMLSEYQPALYQGGLIMVALATALVIAAVSHPQARLGFFMGTQPLRWIGLRSYGIYLWHWPIFMVTRPYLDVPFDGWALLALRLMLVLVLADLSYRLVELPVRRGALAQLWPTLLPARRTATSARTQLERSRDKRGMQPNTGRIGD